MRSLAAVLSLPTILLAQSIVPKIEAMDEENAATVAFLNPEYLAYHLSEIEGETSARRSPGTDRRRRLPTSVSRPYFVINSFGEKMAPHLGEKAEAIAKVKQGRTEYAQLMVQIGPIKP